MHEASKRLAVPLLARISGSIGPAQAVEVVAEPIAAEDLNLELRLERIAEGFEHPWSVVLLPDGRFLVSERPGRLSLVGEDGSLSHLDGDVHQGHDGAVYLINDEPKGSLYRLRSMD